MADAIIRVTGLSGSSEITVEQSEDKTLADILEDAGVDSSLSVKLNGETVNPADVSVQTGDQVVTTPPDVKLG